MEIQPGSQNKGSSVIQSGTQAGPGLAFGLPRDVIRFELALA